MRQRCTAAEDVINQSDHVLNIYRSVLVRIALFQVCGWNAAAEGVVNQELFRQLAVLRGELIENTQVKFPDQFNDFASEMEKLGIENVDLNCTAGKSNHLDPSWLRRFRWSEYAKDVAEKGFVPQGKQYY